MPPNHTHKIVYSSNTIVCTTKILMSSINLVKVINDQKCLKKIDTWYLCHMCICCYEAGMRFFLEYLFMFFYVFFLLLELIQNMVLVTDSITLH